METIRGWWTLTTTAEPDQTTLEHISKLIAEGFTSGEIIIEADTEGETL